MPAHTQAWVAIMVIGLLVSPATILMAQEREYGDAPEGATAYPSLGVVGMFPTCKTVGPAGYVEHDNWGAVLGPTFDFEMDGNAGLCPGFNPYDQDECYADNDAGLLFPEPYTIVNNVVVTCPNSQGTPLGAPCTTAVWGSDIDIMVSNNMPNETEGYMNVLFDWDQNGIWSGASPCPGANAPEHVLVDFKVPPGYAGPLSGLNPPNFLIGPNVGYVWARFTISERPVGQDWTGEGGFEDGESEDYLIEIRDVQDELDWGDAPDSPFAPGYPTLAINNGANHVIGGPWLGDRSDNPDPEPDGQPDPAALGDDTDIVYPPPNDDEDGVQIPVLMQGQTATITFEVNGGGGGVAGWIDYNGNKIWEASEQVVAASYPNGIQSVNITVPNNAVVGQTFARFRISTTTIALGPDGPAPDGEVEDHEVFIEEGPGEEIDWGDAPDSAAALGYPTLASSNGANHLIVPGGPFMGAGIDDEPDGQPDPNALGDDNDIDPGNPPPNFDDEDGVMFTSPMVPNQSATVDIDMSGSTVGGMLDAWVDFNADNSWAEPGDQIFANVPLTAGGINSLTFNVPATATPGIVTFARFRVSINGGLPEFGPAPDGEVEDYEVFIEESCPEAFLLEFSLDIGSDKELSDPNVDGDEGFDPGDVYLWRSAPVTPPAVPGGRDGFKDDMHIFGQDPPPDPPDPSFPPASAVPVGMGGPDMYKYFFDLDGHDQLDISLLEMIGDISAPLAIPIPQFPSKCIFEVEFLAVSFDDDMAPGWPNFDVPVMASSPAGLVYGMTGPRDEITGVNLLPAAMPPVPIMAQYPITDEANIHPDLAPNPDFSEKEDDDVDSLDLVPKAIEPDQPCCPFWYFSADHEATWFDMTGLPLDPGGIYEVQAGGPVKVIDEFIHLGISEDADIDAFEFVWMMHPDDPGQMFLALLFSVDEDDPLTPNINESGNLNPNMIYYSFLTGWSADLLEHPLDDDVDALTNWCSEIIVPDIIPPTMLSAVSRMTHGTAGDMDLNLVLAPPNAASIECRTYPVGGASANGPTKVVVTFSEPVIPGAVTLSSGTLGAVVPMGNDVVINMSGVANNACLAIVLNGFTDLAGNPLAGDNDIHIIVVQGEVDMVAPVNLFDLVAVKTQLFLPVTPANYRSDVRADGMINIWDLQDVKANLFSSATCP